MIMENNIFFFDILKYTISGLLIIFAAYFLFKSHLDQIKNPLATDKFIPFRDVSPLKIQAYERMILFIERINPANLLLRLHLAGMSAVEMQNLIMAEVRAEYQHNITQQLYFGKEAWGIIKRVKDDTINLVNQSVAKLPADASAVDLSKIIFCNKMTMINKFL
jgi:hypothetical protein